MGDIRKTPWCQRTSSGNVSSVITTRLMVRKNIEVMVITVQSWVYYLGITAMKHTVVTKAHAVIKLTFGGCETLNSEQIVEQIKTKTNSFKKFDIIDKHANWDSNIVFKVVQRGHKKKLFTENFTDKFDMSVFHTSMHVRTNSPSTGSWDNREMKGNTYWLWQAKNKQQTLPQTLTLWFSDLLERMGWEAAALCPFSTPLPARPAPLTAGRALEAHSSPHGAANQRPPQHPDPALSGPATRVTKSHYRSWKRSWSWISINQHLIAL